MQLFDWMESLSDQKYIINLHPIKMFFSGHFTYCNITECSTNNKLWNTWCFYSMVYFNLWFLAYMCLPKIPVSWL